MGKTIDLYLSGEISPGITELELTQQIGKTSRPILVGNTSVIQNFIAYSESNDISPSFDLAFSISTDSGQSYSTEYTETIPANTLYQISFLGLVLPQCSLLKVKYLKNSGLIANIQISMTLGALR